MEVLEENLKKPFSQKKNTNGGDGIRTPPLGNASQRAHHWAVNHLVTQAYSQVKINKTNNLKI
jgi:hypothetical protein